MVRIVAGEDDQEQPIDLVGSPRDPDISIRPDTPLSRADIEQLDALVQPDCPGHEPGEVPTQGHRDKAD